MITTVFLSLVVLSLAVYGLFLAITLRFRPGREARFGAGLCFPRVTLLKPLKNRVDDLEANLESYFLLDYPNYEIVFGLDTMNDPSLPLIRSLQERFPQIPVRVVATGHSDQVNPKIFKLARMERLATGSLLWVTDANTRAGTDTLRRLVGEQQRRGAHLVFSPIHGVGSRSLGSLMENMGLNLFTSGSILAAWTLLGQQILVGKSMLIEKSALDHFGGFAYFSEFLAEDFVIGEAFENAGFTLSCAPTWIENVNRSTTVPGFYRRLARWARLRMRLKPAVYVLELLLNPLTLSLPLPWLLPGMGWQAMAAAWGFKIVVEAAGYLALSRRRGEPWHLLALLPAAVPLKDFILLLVYLVPFFSRTIVWQGGGVAIGRRTRIAGAREIPVLEGG